MEDGCILCGISDTNPTLIKKFPGWSLLIDFRQNTLGSCLLVPDEHHESLSGLFEGISEVDVIEYADIVIAYEKALKAAFNPNLYNHLMMANVVKHIHWHIRPRYSERRVFAGRTWTDEKFGGRTGSSGKELDQEILDPIIREIRKYL